MRGPTSVIPACRRYQVGVRALEFRHLGRSSFDRTARPSDVVGDLRQRQLRFRRQAGQNHHRRFRRRFHRRFHRRRPACGGVVDEVGRERAAHPQAAGLELERGLWRAHLATGGKDARDTRSPCLSPLATPRSWRSTATGSTSSTC